MAVKPVDFQVMIPRTMEAAKASNDDTQKNLALQHHRVTTAQHKALDSLKQVYSRPQAQDVRIMEKQKDNRQNNSKKKKNQHNTDENEGNLQIEGNGKKRLNNEARASTIDIKI